MLPSEIKNKIKREQIYHKLKSEKSRAKLKQRLKQKKEEENNPELKAQRLAENVPATLETLREADETLVGDDEEVFMDEDTDEFASYFQQGMEPKILITTSKRASAHVYDFAKEFTGIFPDAQFVKRGSQFDVKRIVEIGIEREYTDVMIINEDRKKASNLYSCRCHYHDSFTSWPYCLL